MAKKRANNEGTTHRLKSGTWRAQVSLNGQRLSFTSKTQYECHEWIKKTNGQIDDGMTYTSTRTTLREFLNDWLSSSKASKRQRTWTHYEQLTRTYILPHLGKIKVKDLRPDQIQSMYNILLAQGVGTYTVLKIHTLLHSALGHALKTGMIARNPVGLTMPPKEPSKEMKTLDESGVSQLLIAAKPIFRTLPTE